MADLKDIIKPKYIATYWIENPLLLEPYFGESKFPNKKQIGLRLDYIKGASRSPVSLSASNFDVDVIKRTRQGFEALSMEMPYFKNAMTVDEETRQKLLMIGENNEKLRDVVINKVFDDATNLIKDARVTAEKLRMEALTTGAIAIADNGVSKSYDFKVPASQKITLTGTEKWDDSEHCDPLKNIEDWQIQMAKKGVVINELLMNSATFDLIRKSKSIKSNFVVNVKSGDLATVSRSRIKEYIQTETNTIIYVYDKGYEDTDGNFVKFVPDNVVVAMPSKPLGNTYFGTTPAEADLMGDSKAVDNVSIVDTGVAIARDSNVDPVWKRIIVSEICLPSFEMADAVIIATVA